MKIGTDIIQISKFVKTLNKSRESFIDRYFGEDVSNSSAESIAGLFAAKEAIMKTGFISVDDYKKIKVVKDLEGRPYVENFEDKVDISISHDGDYVIAVATWNDQSGPKFL